MLLAMGAAGGLHCAGMCGGLAALAGRGPWRFLLYTAGRTSSYILLGTLAGALGRAVAFGLGGRVLAVAAGVALLAAGLESLGLLRVRLPDFAGRMGAIARLAGSGAAGSLLTGAVNGLLPCPMVYGFVAMAAVAGSAVGGAGVMAVLAATSTVPLAGCALLGRRIGVGRRAAGVLMVAVAGLTLYRGFSPAGTTGHVHGLEMQTGKEESQRRNAP